jgi:sigma-B regulation protein RsbU (phosphoserine phosphatase)
MLRTRRPWQEELEIIDKTMKSISGVTDPEELVEKYWDGIGDLIKVGDYVAVSRRNVESPGYLITRSSRFTEQLNPWTQRDRLPRASGGLLGEILYGNKPVIIINDLASRLEDDDPARFYLEGFASLVALPQYDDGEALNCTCMLFPPGTEPDPAMIPMLHWQGGLFGRGTQNLVLRNELTKALGALDRELQAVGEIQRSLLPQDLPQIPGFEIATYYQTSARAGGDYYDFFPLPSGGWGIFIADVSGHGTPAAVLMAVVHAVAHAQPGTHTPPVQLLRHLNRSLTRSYTRGGTFVTAFYAVLDPDQRTLTYSRAGHNPPRLVRGDHVISLEERGALPLGILDDQMFQETTIRLETGDLLLLYTDGITETRGAAQPTAGTAAKSHELFGVERLDHLLLDCCSETAGGCITRVRDEVAAFSNNAPPADDQTVVAIRVGQRECPA